MKIFLTFIAIVVLTGCSSFNPLPISEPPAKDSSDVRTVPDYQKGGLLPATTPQEVKNNIKIYADWYMERSLELRGYEYKTSDTGLVGGIIGVLGGIAKSPEAALAGGLLASGASMTSQRYQFLVQAQNYEKASDALYCMYRNVYPAPSVTTSGITKINHVIDELRIKLRKSQANITIANPDLAELEASIKQQLESKSNQITVKSGLIAKSATQAQVDAADEKLLIDELVKCAAGF
jgi:hypothetical protein